MDLKDGTTFNDLDSNIIMAAIIADGVWQELGRVQGVTLTSGTDGNHSQGSLHYPENAPNGQCRAIDLRVWNLPQGRSQAPEAASKLKERLTANYDVLAEKLDSGEYSHIHVEYDP